MKIHLLKTTALVAAANKSIAFFGPFKKKPKKDYKSMRERPLPKPESSKKDKSEYQMHKHKPATAAGGKKLDPKTVATELMAAVAKRWPQLAKDFGPPQYAKKDIGSDAIHAKGQGQSRLYVYQDGGLWQGFVAVSIPGMKESKTTYRAIPEVVLHMPENSKGAKDFPEMVKLFAAAKKNNRAGLIRLMKHIESTPANTKKALDYFDKTVASSATVAGKALAASKFNSRQFAKDLAAAFGGAAQDGEFGTGYAEFSIVGTKGAPFGPGRVKIAEINFECAAPEGPAYSLSYLFYDGKTRPSFKSVTGDLKNYKAGDDVAKVTKAIASFLLGKQSAASKEYAKKAGAKVSK